VPEVSVIQLELVLFGLTVRKACDNCLFNDRCKEENSIFLILIVKGLESAIRWWNFKRNDKMCILKGISRVKTAA